MPKITEVPNEALENTLDDLFKTGEDAMKEILAGQAEEPEAVVEEVPAEEVVEEVEAEAEEEAVEEEAEVEEVAEEPEEEVEPLAAEEVTLKVGDEEIALTVEDEDTRQAVAAIQNQLDEVEVLRAHQEQIETQAVDVGEREAAIQDQLDALAIDPSEFLLSKVPEGSRQDVALDLLLDDALFEFVSGKMDAWANVPGQRNIDAAERKAERTEHRVEAERAVAEGRVSRATAHEIVKKVQGFVPEGYDVHMAQAFYRDAMDDIQRHVKAGNELTADDIPKLLKPRLKLYKLTEKPVVEDPGKQFVARRAKKLAAATAPGGAGSAPTRARPPKGSTLEGAVEWARGNLKTG